MCDLCAHASPSFVQGIYFLLAVKVEPDHHGSLILEVISNRSIRENDSGPTLRNTSDSAFVSSPVDGKTKALFIVRERLIHIGHENLSDCTGEFGCQFCYR